MSAAKWMFSPGCAISAQRSTSASCRPLNWSVFGPSTPASLLLFEPQPLERRGFVERGRRVGVVFQQPRGAGTVIGQVEPAIQLWFAVAPRTVRRNPSAGGGCQPFHPFLRCDGMGHRLAAHAVQLGRGVFDVVLDLAQREPIGRGFVPIRRSAHVGEGESQPFGFVAPAGAFGQADLLHRASLWLSPMWAGARADASTAPRPQVRCRPIRPTPRPPAGPRCRPRRWCRCRCGVRSRRGPRRCRRSAAGSLRCALPAPARTRGRIPRRPTRPRRQSLDLRQQVGGGQPVQRHADAAMAGKLGGLGLGGRIARTKAQDRVARIAAQAVRFARGSGQRDRH